MVLKYWNLLNKVVIIIIKQVSEQNVLYLYSPLETVQWLLVILRRLLILLLYMDLVHNNLYKFNTVTILKLFLGLQDIGLL